MKIKPVIIFLLASFIYFFASAQEKKLKFHSINAGGVTVGQTGGYILFQTLNGVAYKKWYTGIGVGADHYHYKSYPLFIDFRRYFDKDGKSFAYADLGYNFPGKNIPGNEVSFYSSFHFTGGLYSDVGIGYKIKFIKNTSCILVGGYSYKKLHDKVGVITCPFIGPCFENTYNYNYGLGRMLLKAGIMF